MKFFSLKKNYRITCAYPRLNDPDFVGRLVIVREFCCNVDSAGYLITDEHKRLLFRDFFRSDVIAFDSIVKYIHEDHAVGVNDLFRDPLLNLAPYWEPPSMVTLH